MRHLKTILTVIGAVSVIVLAGNSVTAAATGHGFLLGKSNRSTAMTTLSRSTPGAALLLKTKSLHSPPLATNGRGKVVNLNADKVDGYDGGTRVLSWTSTDDIGESRTMILKDLPAGNYLISWSAFAGKSDEGSQGDCYLFTNTAVSGPTRYTAESTNATGPYGLALNGNGLVHQGPGDTTGLKCAINVGQWILQDNEPTKITAIPLAAVTYEATPEPNVDRTRQRK